MTSFPSLITPYLDVSRYNHQRFGSQVLSGARILKVNASPLCARTLIQVLSYSVSTYLVKEGPFSAWHAGHLSFSIGPAGFQLLYKARKNGRGTGQLIQTIILKIDWKISRIQQAQNGDPNFNLRDFHVVKNYQQPLAIKHSLLFQKLRYITCEVLSYGSLCHDFLERVISYKKRYVNHASQTTIA